jgi:ubiquinone/menaquinone biosynthesis C-methylase UbiE
LDVLSNCLAATKLRLIGCDVSEEMLRVARVNVPHATLLVFNGHQLPLAAASFDLVLLISVLHHLYDPLPLLREAARVLARRGILIIAQEPNPAVNGPFRRLRQTIGLLPDASVLRAEYHQFMTDGLAPQQLRQALAECGLSSTLDYTNAALCDELQSKLRGHFGWALTPLLWFKSPYLSLSYTIVATRTS